MALGWALNLSGAAMSEDNPTNYAIDQILNLPFFVVDALFDYLFRHTFTEKSFQVRRKTLSAGSSLYSVRIDGALFGTAEIIATGERATWIQVQASNALIRQAIAEKDKHGNSATEEDARQMVNFLLSILFGYIIEILESAEQGRPTRLEFGASQGLSILQRIHEVQMLQNPGTAKKMKRGRTMEAFNKWAVAQFNEGKTLEDILPEYARKRRMNQVEARELLRKVHNVWKKKPE